MLSSKLQPFLTIGCLDNIIFLLFKEFFHHILCIWIIINDKYGIARICSYFIFQSFTFALFFHYFYWYGYSKRGSLTFF